MFDWQKRVIEERELLKEKADKLENFLTEQSEKKDLKDYEVGLLRVQSLSMRTYLEVLDVRISLFIYSTIPTMVLIIIANVTHDLSNLSPIL